MERVTEIPTAFELPNVKLHDVECSLQASECCPDGPSQTAHKFRQMSRKGLYGGGVINGIRSAHSAGWRLRKNNARGRPNEYSCIGMPDVT